MVPVGSTPSPPVIMHDDGDEQHCLLCGTPIALGCNHWAHILCTCPVLSSARGKLVSRLTSTVRLRWAVSVLSVRLRAASPLTTGPEDCRVLSSSTRPGHRPCCLRPLWNVSRQGKKCCGVVVRDGYRMEGCAPLSACPLGVVTGVSLQRILRGHLLRCSDATVITD